MDANLPAPTDRPSFNAALADVLADIMAAHELVEARLFATPFLTRTPQSVLSTTTQVRMRCRDFLTGNHHLPDTNASAALFVEALLAHIAAEEAWFAREQQYWKDNPWADA